MSIRFDEHMMCTYRVMYAVLYWANRAAASSSMHFWRLNHLVVWSFCTNQLVSSDPTTQRRAFIVTFNPLFDSDNARWHLRSFIARFFSYIYIYYYLCEFLYITAVPPSPFIIGIERKRKKTFLQRWLDSLPSKSHQFGTTTDGLEFDVFRQVH